MSAAKVTTKKSAAASPAGGPSGIFARGKWLILAAILGGAAYFGWREIWNYVGPSVRANPEYRVTAEKISITPLPAWIKSDIKSQVIRDGSLDGGPSVLDDGLAEQVAKAFALSPWVEEVKQVRKMAGGRVEVELVYRKPVCMVETPPAEVSVDGQAVEAAKGLLPIDVHGVLLPSSDFTSDDARDYPRLAGARFTTIGPTGSVWNDERITGGARIAAQLAPHWREWKLERIVAIDAAPKVFESAEQRGVSFELKTQSGTTIPWGMMSGKEEEADAVAAARTAKLKEHVAAKGSLDSGAPPDLTLITVASVKAGG